MDFLTNMSEILSKIAIAAGGSALALEVADHNLVWFNQYIYFMNTNVSAVAATIAMLSFILQVIVNIYRIRRE